MSKNEKTRKYIIYFRFTVLLLALAIPVIFNIYNYYSGTDYWIITLDVAPLFIGFTIWLLIPYIILIGISFFWKKIAQLFGAGALMLTVEFLVNLSLDRNSMDVLVFLVLPILQAIIILPIGMGLGFIASFLIKNYQTGKSMTTYQKNVLGFALIILLPLCFFIYLQKSDDVVVRFIVSSLQWEDTWAEDWYFVANKTRNDPEKQIKRYSSALKFKPNFAEAYRARAGIKHNRLKDYKGAIQDYNKAIESKPHFHSNIKRGEGYYINLYIWRGRAKEKLKDYKGAIEDYTKAIELNPTDGWSRADAYKRRGVLEEVLEEIVDYNKAIELNPNDADAYYNRGVVRADLKDYSGAIHDYNKAIELNPNFDKAYVSRGYTKAIKKDDKGAITDFNKAIEINPNYADAYYNRGNSKQKLQDNRGAIQDFTKAIELIPNYAVAYNNRGNSKQKLLDYRGAIQDYNKAIEINPNIANAYYNRGNSKQKLQDYRGAIQDFTKAIELYPIYVNAYYNRGYAKDNLQDYKGAIQDYTKAIDLNPNYAEAYLFRGYAKIFLGQRDHGCLDLSKAGERGLAKAYEAIKLGCN